MPRGVPDLKFIRAKFESHAMHKIDRWFGTGVNIKAIECAAPTRTPEYMVIWMQCHMRKWIQRIRDRRRTADVIEVRVRVPKMTDPPAAILCGFEDEMSIP